MKPCPNCKELIASSAKSCLKCGKRFGIPTFVKVLIILAVIGICMFGCVAACTKTVSDAVNEVDNEYKDVNGKEEFAIGESFQNKYLKVTVVSANLDYKSSNQYSKPSDGKKYVQVVINAENVGEKASDISYLYFNLYADGVKCPVSSGGELDLDFGGTISPGKFTKGALYYEVPVDSKKITLEYEPNVLDSKNRVSFKLN